MKKKTLKKSDATSPRRRTRIRNITVRATKHSSRRNAANASTPLGTAVAEPAEAAEAGEQLLHFFEYHPPERVSRNLRRMMMEFLMTDSGIEAPYLKDLLYELEGLFEVLEVERFKKFEKPEKFNRSERLERFER